MFISCGDQAGQILRVLLRMTSESAAVAQTFADLLPKAVCCGADFENSYSGEHGAHLSRLGGKQRENSSRVLSVLDSRRAAGVGEIGRRCLRLAFKRFNQQLASARVCGVRFKPRLRDYSRRWSPHNQISTVSPGL